MEGIFEGDMYKKYDLYFIEINHISMSQNAYLREGRFFKREGDVEFEMVTIDGISLCPFPCEYSPGGYPKRIWDIQNLDCRPDDVVLVTYPKSGTHWTSEILNMILHETADYMKDSKVSAMLEALPNLNMLERLQSPRVLNTHLPYKWLPQKHIESGGKIIHTMRNPKDAYVSFFHHLINSSDLGPKSTNMTWTQYFNNFVIGKDIPYGTWFDYVKEMEEAMKKNKFIYTLHFEALKRNPIQEIKLLSTFLERPISEALTKDIADKCDFSNLKRAEKEVKQLPPEILEMIEEYKKIMPDYKEMNVYRKGIVGDWKNHFTVAQNEQFDALYKKEMKNSSVEVIY